MTTDLPSEDDRDCIVQNTLAKNEHVEDLVDIESVEDGQRGDGVHGRDQGPESEALHESQTVNHVRLERKNEQIRYHFKQKIFAFKVWLCEGTKQRTNLSQEVNAAPDNERRYDRTKNSESQNGPDVLKEISLQRLIFLVNNGRQPVRQKRLLIILVAIIPFK